jgi:cbb3-type cytochrome c oxidase subunit III
MKARMPIVALSAMILAGNVLAATGESKEDDASTKRSGEAISLRASTQMSDELLAKVMSTTQVARADTPETILGKEKYQYWCATCHAPGVFKRGLLPGTASLAFKYDGALPAVLEHRSDLSREYVKYVIRNGSEGMPFFRKTEVSDREMEAIAAYLALNDAAAPADKAQARSVQEILSTTCAACHGAQLQGGVGPALTSPTYVHGRSKEAIARSIANGFLEKGMPNFRGVLSDREIDALATYLSTNGSAR